MRVCWTWTLVMYLEAEFPHATCRVSPRNNHCNTLDWLNVLVFMWKVKKNFSFNYQKDGNILTDENEILSRWREYFEDLLNPVKASTRDTYEVTHLREDEVFTAAEVATAIKGIKSGKAAGEDEIRPEMLKALTGEGILWLTRVCQVAWKLGKTPRDWQTGVIIPIFKIRRSQALYKLERDITP